jgi:hypothetical protein
LIVLKRENILVFKSLFYFQVYSISQYNNGGNQLRSKHQGSSTIHDKNARK